MIGRVASLVAASILGLGACGDDRVSPPVDAAQLEDTTWVRSETSGGAVGRGSARFANGQLVGSAGCNGFGGTYVRDAERLMIGDVASRRKSCGPREDAAEAAYLAALGRVASWQLHGDSLELRDAGGAVILRYDPATPVGEWTVTGLWDGVQVSPPIPGSRLTMRLDSGGRASGSAGCNRYGSRFTADDETVTIGAANGNGTVTATQMACASPDGIMGQEARFLRLLDRVRRYRVGGITLELTGTDGAQLIVLERAPG